MVVQPTRVSMVGGSNSSKVNFTPPPPPPPKVSRPGFEPRTENFASAVLPFHQQLCVGGVCPRCLEPFERNLLTPPQKSDIQFYGVEASESKDPLRDALVGQNNDFTKCWTSNIMPPTYCKIIGPWKKSTISHSNQQFLGFPKDISHCALAFFDAKFTCFNSNCRGHLTRPGKFFNPKDVCLILTVTSVADLVRAYHKCWLRQEHPV